MAKKIFSLTSNPYFTKQFPGGGRNQILGSVVGCALLYIYGTRKPKTQQTLYRTQTIDGKAWF